MNLISTMTFAKNLLLIFLLLPLCIQAVVTRHDVPKENYQTKAPDFLVNLPHEGHGVLISPQWIVTVAHTLFYDYRGKKLLIGGKEYIIEKVYIHPLYSKPKENLLIGDAQPLIHFFKMRTDIALIKLSTSVSDSIKPIAIYDGHHEKNKLITVYGKGATGTGLTGEIVASKKLEMMNHFQNKIEGAKDHWLNYKFDKPPGALDLEGMHGSGDSGGASIIYLKGKPYLVGLSSWQEWNGDLSEFQGGLYNTIAYQVRLSYFSEWITEIIHKEIN